MTQDLMQAAASFVAVAGGLFVLWSLFGRMRDLPVSTRAGFAAVAGTVSAIATLVVTWIVRGTTSGVPPA